MHPAQPEVSKRSRKVVENDSYVAFTRRILRAYARRVASGDIEALRSMTLLTADVDAATRAAVQGLRDFGYSWAEIGDRLGVTRQAAQQRWGNPADRNALDSRLLSVGMDVTVTVLVAVFIDHFRGVSTVVTCPGCGHVYGADERDCPTITVVRPLLAKRRHEDPTASGRLSYEQFTDLTTRDHTSRARRATPRPDRPGLFNLYPDPSEERS